MRIAALTFLVVLGACDQTGVAAQPTSTKATEPKAEQSAPPAPKLGFPVACDVGKSCEIQNYVDRAPGPEALDYRCLTRTYNDHNGVDIRLPDLEAQRAGVPVLSAAAGRVARVRDGVEDISVQARGVAAVAGQECGNGVVLDHGNGWETQYCHLRRGSIQVKAEQIVAPGEPLAQVGISGLSEYPHLHFTVRHNGAVIDPFAPDAGDVSCNSTTPLWTAAALQQLTYRRGAILNSGFAAGPVSMQMVESREVPAPDPHSGALVAYVRAIALEQGATQVVTLTGPSGAVIAENRAPPLANGRAQQLLFVGKKSPPAGWPTGTYRARYQATLNGAILLEKAFELRLP